MSPLASQLLLWLVLASAAAGLTVVVVAVLVRLSRCGWVERINARVAAEYDANPLGGAELWNGEVRR